LSKKLPVDRKYELMIRDDEFNNYIEKSRQWLKDPNDEALTKEVEQLKQRVRDKWNARIHWPESTIQGVTDFWMLVHEPYKAVVDARVGSTLRIEKDRQITFASYEDNGLIHCPPDKIPIIIDPTILTLHDGEKVKEEVWEIVKAEILKRKNTIKGRDIPDDLVPFLPDYIEQKTTIKGRDFAIPAKEPEALAAVFRCKTETFERNLRWYDLNMKEGLTFRLIAFIEFHSKPEEREQKFEEHIGRKKQFRNIGPVEEEDTVRKGVGMIYQAIFRKPMSAQNSHISTLGKYNCPYHSWNQNTQDWDCDADCEYLKSYSTRLSHF
jgi:hypothetical protein